MKTETAIRTGETRRCLACHNGMISRGSLTRKFRTQFRYREDGRDEVHRLFSNQIKISSQGLDIFIDC